MYKRSLGSRCPPHHASFQYHLPAFEGVLLQPCDAISLSNLFGALEIVGIDLAELVFWRRGCFHGDCVSLFVDGGGLCVVFDFMAAVFCFCEQAAALIAPSTIANQ